MDIEKIKYAVSLILEAIEEEPKYKRTWDSEDITKDIMRWRKSFNGDTITRQDLFYSVRAVNGNGYSARAIFQEVRRLFPNAKDTQIRDSGRRKRVFKF